MKRTITALILAVAAACPIAALAGPPAPDVPSGIGVTDGSKPYLIAHAVGVQIYSCDGTAWRFVAPRAALYDDHDHLVVTHFAGPTWQTRDGSRVVGRRVAGINVDPTAIDWLLLSTTPGDKPGRLSQTTWIQRIATVGGIAPAAATCSAATAGTTHEVPYRADYVFWK
jgi:hypothetical protein